MQIRGTNEAAPCLPSQFTLMMTNTFVHGEGRWELQYASNHCPPEMSPLSPPPSPSFFLFIFLTYSHIPSFLNPISALVNNPFSCPLFFFFYFSLFCSSFRSGLTVSPTKLTRNRRWQWFARGQCYLNRPIGLFAIAPSIRQEAPRNQPITSISHDGIQ